MRLSIISTAAMLAASVAFADSVSPNDVKFDEYGAIEASLSGAPGDAANGAKVMTTRSKGNCVACHAVTALQDAPFHGEVGPTLDGVGGYRSAEELRGIVANAKMMFEGTVMPAFYKTSGFTRPGDGYTGKAAKEEDLTPILTAQEVEDVVAFLLTLQD
ncbi:sulfur oxidation c-type cytochrome SoxX [Aestuariicoccus sp. MJ-SS9]|uniref:sulfur oxidation c-type cytochrome SoxX n=1 Tax=Aestuariicoccus sp. MJ-SS9 TaxID=3079855 RepID=UPI002910393F|nr:sulfur oxidation c-type cytochrome SoxX [Aestuariicoccus sp. MJ-SS9]MDU8911201.1 sulfur oxidation c-type cytochrome SoxX [Aestuariicoccus sp. MJ-SS9]